MKAVFKTTGGTPPGGAGGRGGGDSTSRSFVAGDYIFHEGDLGTEMYIIQEGTVTISKHLSGEDHRISTLERGDFFGEMALLESLPRTADAIADNDVRLIAINGSRFDEMLRKNPEIAVRIIRKYSQRLREANDLIEKLAGRNDSLSPSEAPPAQPQQNEAHDPDSDATGPRVVDLASGEAFYFGSGDLVLIGRSDPVTGIRPDIDLTDADVNRSVSRRHAKLVKTLDGWAVLEEVGTVNGTFVNDQRVPPGVPVPLREGDRLKIGLVQMKVILES